jgi:hypothetical protein
MSCNLGKLNFLEPSGPLQARNGTALPFRTKLLVANRVIIRQRTKFDTEQKSLKFLLEIMTLVSSANNTGSDTEFILRGRSFIYIMNNRGPRNYPWGTPYFNVPQSREKRKTERAVLGDFTSTFYLLLVK